MKTAIFSNGHKDEYKGTRDVKFAWMVTETSSGNVVASGHSLSRENANKTGRGSIPLAAQLPGGWTYCKNTIHGYQYAKKQGYNSPSEMAADYKKQNAEKAKLYSVEVVSL